MPFMFKLHVWGPFACFTRPALKGERVSYDVITPSAARAIFEAIYWHPGIRWHIHRIHVLKPIQTMGFRRNEVADILSERTIKTAMKGGAPPVLYSEDSRQQRASLLLKDVAYGLVGDIELLSPQKGPRGKHLEMFRRRAGKGQCFNQPYFGCREFPAYFELVDAFPDAHESLAGTQQLGSMLMDIDYQADHTSHFFQATMNNGVLQVPAWSSRQVRP